MLKYHIEIKITIHFVIITTYTCLLPYITIFYDFLLGVFWMLKLSLDAGISYTFESKLFLLFFTCPYFSHFTVHWAKVWKPLVRYGALIRREVE